MQLPLVYEYEDRIKVRTINIGGEIWFFAKDVCDVLGIANTGSAYARIDKDDIGQTDGVDTKGRKIKSYIVSEFGLYELILQSTKPEAKKFKRWVTHEVLPSIRSTGGYLVPGARVALPAFVRRFNENWEGHWYIYRQATSAQAARDVESALINTHGTDGGGGGGDDSSAFVYAYKKTSITEP